MTGDKCRDGEDANISTDSQGIHNIFTDSLPANWEHGAGRKGGKFAFFSRFPLRAVLFPKDVSPLVLH